MKITFKTVILYNNPKILVSLLIHKKRIIRKKLFSWRDKVKNAHFDSETKKGKIFKKFSHYHTSKHVYQIQYFYGMIEQNLEK